MVITTKELIELLENKIKHKNNNQDFILIDVREPEELEIYDKIDTSINIPLTVFEEVFSNIKKLEELGIDKNKKLILYCMSGGRSSMATEYLKQLGFNAENYSGSLIDWMKHKKQK